MDGAYRILAGAAFRFAFARLCFGTRAARTSMAECGSSSSRDRVNNYARRFRKGAIAELLRQTIAMRRLGA
jgi:hypothetical protein